MGIRRESVTAERILPRVRGEYDAAGELEEIAETMIEDQAKQRKEAKGFAMMDSGLSR